MENLTGGGPRHLVVSDEGNRFRSFVTGDPFGTPGEEFGFACRHAIAKDQQSVNRFTPFLVRPAYYSNVLYFRMGTKKISRFRRGKYSRRLK